MMREQRKMQKRQIRVRIWRILAVLVPSIFGGRCCLFDGKGGTGSEGRRVD